MVPLTVNPNVTVYINEAGCMVAKTNIAPDMVVNVVRVGDLVKDTNDGKPFMVEVRPYRPQLPSTSDLPRVEV